MKEKRRKVLPPMTTMDAIIITKVGESIKSKGVDINLDPHLTEVEKKIGPTEDTLDFNQ